MDSRNKTLPTLPVTFLIAVKKMVMAAGFEPATYGLEGRCSIQAELRHLAHMTSSHYYPLIHPTTNHYYITFYATFCSVDDSSVSFVGFSDCNLLADFFSSGSGV